MRFIWWWSPSPIEHEMTEAAPILIPKEKLIKVKFTVKLKLMVTNSCTPSPSCWCKKCPPNLWEEWRSGRRSLVQHDESMKVAHDMLSCDLNPDFFWRSQLKKRMSIKPELWWFGNYLLQVEMNGNNSVLYSQLRNLFVLRQLFQHFIYQSKATNILIAGYIRGNLYSINWHLLFICYTFKSELFFWKTLWPYTH